MNDYDIYSFMEDSCLPTAPGCPSYGAPHSKYQRNGSYQCHFVCYEDGDVCSRTIKIRSVRVRILVNQAFSK